MSFKSFSITILVVAAGCSGGPSLQEKEIAPYRAVIAFRWPEAETAGGNGGGSPAEESDPEAGERLFRESIEKEIFDGLKEDGIFSDLLPADNDPLATAESRKADLLVTVNLNELVQWEDDAYRTVGGTAALNTGLWITTGVGSWWIADREFSTRSDIVVEWERTDLRKDGRPKPFKDNFLISTGRYRVSMWDRAKPWRCPQAYLLSLLIPAPFVPLQDSVEVDGSLVAIAMKDIRRQLSQGFQERVIGSAGCPFRFELEEPRNGARIKGGEVTLLFRYEVESLARQEHEDTLLRALEVELLPAGEEEFVPIPVTEKIGSINQRISKKNEPIRVHASGLEPGLNLIRFGAQAERNDQWTTNTVAIVAE